MLLESRVIYHIVETRTTELGFEQSNGTSLRNKKCSTEGAAPINQVIQLHVGKKVLGALAWSQKIWKS